MLTHTVIYNMEIIMKQSNLNRKLKSRSSFYYQWVMAILKGLDEIGDNCSYKLYNNYQQSLQYIKRFEPDVFAIAITHYHNIQVYGRKS